MTISTSETLHATCVAIAGRGVLIEGPSGSGKSDLALCLIDRGATLVSDDYTILRRSNDKLVAIAPANISGFMEVRGLGLIPMAHTSDVPVALIVCLRDQVERLPEEHEMRMVAGLPMPVCQLLACQTSSPIKVELALKMHGLK